MYMISVIKLV